MEIVNPQLTFDWLRSHFTGKGVPVAVVDSGVEATHPELAGRVTRGCVVRRGPNGQIQYRECTGPECVDSYGHGTSVAGAVLSVAPEAQIISVKVLNEYNECTGNELIAGLQWALEQRIRLINMSLATAKQGFALPLYDLCERAYVQDTILVASKRNWGHVGWPAKLLSVISIDRGNFEDANQLQHLPKSLVEFAAHGTGVELPTRNGGYALQTGTSFATPRVTGMVALLLEAFPNLLSWQAKTVLHALCRNERRITE